jgi:hypothetical protein
MAETVRFRVEGLSDWNGYEGAMTHEIEADAAMLATLAAAHAAGAVVVEEGAEALVSEHVESDEDSLAKEEGLSDEDRSLNRAVLALQAAQQRALAEAARELEADIENEEAQEAFVARSEILGEQLTKALDQVVGDAEAAARLAQGSEADADAFLEEAK